MEKASKLYAKALQEYHNANLEKALELCEKSISLDLRNSAALNLKGLLLYLKGDLESAKAIWDLNKDYNKDKVSKKYLHNLIEDEKRKLMYESAVKLINEIRIKDAMVFLRNCEESDFNSINVANALAVCLIRQGKYEEAQEYISKVLSIDRKNKEARESRRILNEYATIKKDSEYKKLVLSLSLLTVIGLSAYVGISKYISERGRHNLINMNLDIQKDNVQDKSLVTGQGEEVAKNESSNRDMNKGDSVNKYAAKEEVADKSVVKEETNEPEKKQEDAKIHKFPYNDLTNAIVQKDYTEVYNIVVQWRGKTTDTGEMELLNKGEWLTRREGVEYFYGSALKKIDAQEHGNAVVDLTKAYSFGENSYIYPHVIYMLGFSYQRLGDIDNALRYYEQYVGGYSNGDYTSEVLYNLAILYRDIDLEKSKTYARRITSRFPNAIYNNTRIREILNK